MPTYQWRFASYVVSQTFTANGGMTIG